MMIILLISMPLELSSIIYIRLDSPELINKKYFLEPNSLKKKTKVLLQKYLYEVWTIVYEDEITLNTTI